MKKVLISLSVLGSGIMMTLAQVQVTGGSVTIGVGATQGQVNGGALLGLLALAQIIVARLVPFMIGLAVVAFFWFLIEWIWKGRSDTEAAKRSMAGMGYSILALFVMISIWGIVGFLGSVVGIGGGGKPPSPCLPGNVYPLGDPCY